MSGRLWWRRMGEDRGRVLASCQNHRLTRVGRFKRGNSLECLLQTGPDEPERLCCRGIKEAWQLVRLPPPTPPPARRGVAGHRCHWLIAGRSEGISGTALLKYVRD